MTFEALFNCLYYFQFVRNPEAILIDVESRHYEIYFTT